MTDYSDIINTSWPVSSLRGRMNLNQRAKIFLPFSALPGYEVSLEQERHFKETRSILCNDQMNQINEEMWNIQKDLNSGKSVFVEVIYFKPYFDTNKNMFLYEKGNNVKVLGNLLEMNIGNTMEDSFFIVNDVKIPLADISNLRKL